MTTAELRQLVEGVRFLQRARSHPVDKSGLAEELQPLRRLFTKSVVARVDLAEGTVLRPEHLTVKKPGTGIPASRLPELVGRRVVRRLAANDLIQPHDVESD